MQTRGTRGTDRCECQNKIKTIISRSRTTLKNKRPMKYSKQLFALILLALLSSAAGCIDGEELQSPKTHKDEATHSHGPGDELVWEVKEKIADTDFEIWLGHHGSHFHGGDTIEPSVAIMKNGQAFADAKVFNQLVNPDDIETALTDEVETVYEPGTDEEIAHYAQGDLQIPAEATQSVIRFRIQIPELDEFSRDASVKIGH